MPTLLHIDASARPGFAGEVPHGSHSRALSARFVDRWCRAHPETRVIRRDIGLAPPAHIDHAWIAAAFAPADRADDAMRARLAESDRLVDELVAADVIVIGSPLYNFGMPAALKAWVDGVVRIGRTVDIDPARADPYLPLLDDRPRTAVVLAARGGHDLAPDGPMAAFNHLESHLRTALGFVGITDLREIAIEHQETGGAELAASVAAAQRDVDALVDALLVQFPETRTADAA